jgi:hypothetical protein
VTAPPKIADPDIGNGDENGDDDNNADDEAAAAAATATADDDDADDDDDDDDADSEEGGEGKTGACRDAVGDGEDSAGGEPQLPPRAP